MKFSLFITSILIFSFTLIGSYGLSYVHGTHTCDEPLEYQFGPKWIYEIIICFPSEKGTLFMDEEVEFYFAAIVEEPAKSISIYLVHDSHIVFFKSGEEDYERLLEERKEVGLKEDHIWGIVDNVHTFGIKLEEGKHTKYSCKQVLTEDGKTWIDPPDCKYAYDMEKVLKFTKPGIYHYVVKMQTTTGEIFEDVREIEVFDVADYGKQLDISANKQILEEKEVEVEPILEEKEPEFWGPINILVTIVVGIVAGILTIFVGKQITDKKHRLKKLHEHTEEIINKFHDENESLPKYHGGVDHIRRNYSEFEKIKIFSLKINLLMHLFSNKKELFSLYLEREKLERKNRDWNHFESEIHEKINQIRNHLENVLEIKNSSGPWMKNSDGQWFRNDDAHKWTLEFVYREFKKPKIYQELGTKLYGIGHFCGLNEDHVKKVSEMLEKIFQDSQSKILEMKRDNERIKEIDKEMDHKMDEIIKSVQMKGKQLEGVCKDCLDKTFHSKNDIKKLTKILEKFEEEIRSV